MKIVLHVGIHKTASTFLQKNFFPNFKDVKFLNRERISDFKRYILYEDDFRFSSTEALKIFKKCLVADYENHSILISDEEFYANPFLGSFQRRRNLDRLFNTFGVENVKILMIIRRQPELLSSLYLQYVKTGGVATFTEFIESRWYPLYFNCDYFLFKDYANWAVEMVGIRNLKLVLYEQLVAHKMETLKGIASFVGEYLEPGPVLNDRIANRSISSSLVHLMIFLNKLTVSYKNPFAILPFGFYRFYSAVLISLSRYLKKGTSKVYFSSTDTECIRLSNLELAESFPDLPLEKFGYFNIK